MNKSRGFSTRFDNDLSGNHIQRIKDLANKKYLNVFVNLKIRTCKCCGKKKETKGGKNLSHKFICKQCVDAIEKLNVKNN